MHNENIRLYTLARELNVESEQLLRLCRQAGIDVKSHLSRLGAGQRDAVVQLVKGGRPESGAVTAPAIPTAQARAARPGPVPVLPSRPARQAAAQEGSGPAAGPTPAPQPAASRAVQETTAPAPVNKLSILESRKIRNLNQPRSGSSQRPKATSRLPRPAVIRRATPSPLLAPVRKDEKPAEPKAQPPIARLPNDSPAGAVAAEERANRFALGAPLAPPAVVEDEEAARAAKKGKGGLARRSERGGRARNRWEAEPADGVRTKRGHGRARKPQPQPQSRKGKVWVESPITVRSLSEALGVRAGDLLMRLLKLNTASALTINSTLAPEAAEAVALDVGCKLDVKRPQSAEEQLQAEISWPDRPEDLVPRAPIVTVMGHVDHGKTSLLDRVRHSNVAATEAGGITQVLRAWRVEKDGRPVTFLDTPGHEAFTKMRARGAHVTDIAVIVVAADDGVMPQTEEAIAHAKAAGVALVVAINKVDLPNANVLRTRQQLYALGVLPDNMGGDTPFVETSAATGKGIDDLLDQLAVVAELKELKANPKRPARGTCLEASLSEGEGVRATLLVQDGTLHKGDVVLCGAAYGRVRQVYDDLGRPVQEGGPSVPVRVTGLDEVPNADDPFQVVPDLATARAIAEQRKHRQHQAALVKREPLRLEKLTEAKVAELKVILKADFRGSVEAIRKELEKLHHEEVRVRLLHAGIGAITEGDVQLALTSPQDTLIVGFNVVPDDRALALAEEQGVPIRQHDVIYHLTDDVRAALEGKLKPREQVVHLGRAVVRQTFKVSRVGTIAGSFVTQGIIERSAKIRVIREGVVIYPPADRTASLESLRRFKDDVREVREGFECGLKIANYDDVKVGDVIEAYRVEQVKRTLQP